MLNSFIFSVVFQSVTGKSYRSSVKHSVVPGTAGADIRSSLRSAIEAEYGQLSVFKIDGVVRTA